MKNSHSAVYQSVRSIKDPLHVYEERTHDDIFILTRDIWLMDAPFVLLFYPKHLRMYCRTRHYSKRNYTKVHWSCAGRHSPDLIGDLVDAFLCVGMDVNETQKSVLRLLKHPPSLLRDILIREILFSFIVTIVPLAIPRLVKKLLKSLQRPRMAVFQSWDMFLACPRNLENSSARTKNGSLKI